MENKSETKSERENERSQSRTVARTFSAVKLVFDRESERITSSRGGWVVGSMLENMNETPGEGECGIGGLLNVGVDEY